MQTIFVPLENERRDAGYGTFGSILEIQVVDFTQKDPQTKFSIVLLVLFTK